MNEDNKSVNILNIGGETMQDIIKKIKRMDKKIIKIVDIGLWISFLISILGIIVLCVHYKMYISAELYYIGIEIFKIGLIGAVSLIVCSCGLWLVKEELFK